jgi:LCP family protein required for cell wall assembly
MSRVLLGLISAILVFAVSGCAGLAAGVEDGSKTGKTGKGGKTAKVEKPKPTPTKPPLKIADLVGSDGRLTVLILGSDARDNVIGQRTDTIIVVTIDPGTGRVAMVSLPRDTVNVPIAPGKAYQGRINSLFWEYERSTGKAKTALKKTKNALAYAFDTEIDYYALVEFTGLVRLINSIGGIDVTLDEALIDPTMHLGKRGLRLKAGERHLDGKKALAFSRSRHSDSDYDRSRRQQQVLAATAARIRARGITALPALVELVREKVVTDMPVRAAPALLELAGTAKLGSPKSVVLAPGRWARQLPGSYTITPRVLEVQTMFDRVFKPVD